MKIEVLVTTMQQKDVSKYEEMNLQTDSVIANQADKNENLEEIRYGKSVKMITTDGRGLSRNRNVAIKNIALDTDYVIFADDDLRFYDNYEQIVISAFKEKPKADAIKFNLKCVSKRKLSMKPIVEFHKVSRKKVTSWGVCGLAIKVSVLRENDFLFNERFGSGTENYCGEDTIFLQELFKKGVTVYANPNYIAEIDQSKSSWFEGYNKRYFNVNGMILSEIYPHLCYPLVIRSAYKFSKRDSCQMSFFEILRCYYKGIKENEAEHKLLR